MLCCTALRRCLQFLSLLFALFVGLIWARPTQAATRVVDTLTDSNLTACTAAANDCTLRGAIHGANDHDIITFDPGLAHQTLTLSQDELLITRTLTLDGSTAPTVTISGNNASRVISTSQPLTVTNLIIQDGSVENGSGGGIYAGSDLWLIGSQISNCVVSGFYPNGSGGGIFVAGDAEIENTTFLGNVARIGGGIWAYGYVRLSDSIFLSNTAIEQGGGVGVNGLTSMMNTTFISNTSGQFGGGVFVFGSANFSNSTFLSNAARDHGGGVYVERDATITGTTFISNTAGHYGGGAFVFGSPTVTGTLFLTNAAEIGGGLYMEDWANVINSKFLGNRAELHGGGLFIGMICRAMCESLYTNRVDQKSVQSSLYVPFTEDAGFSITLINTLFDGNRSNLSGGGADIDSSSRVISTTFVNNWAKGYGGGLATDGYITLTATTFFSNSTDGIGGGAEISGGSANIGNTTFLSNHAEYDGGGAHIYGSAHMTDTTWISNSAGSTGGALYFYGRATTPIQVINSRFARNRSTAKQGDAIYMFGLNAIDPYVVNRLILIHNTIANPIMEGGSAIAVQMGIVNITNTIIASHTVAIANAGGVTSENYNLFYGNSKNISGTVESGGQSIEGDPAFVDSSHDDYHLTGASAAIDRGLILDVADDFDGVKRPQGAAPEIGAYEFIGEHKLYLPLLTK